MIFSDNFFIQNLVLQRIIKKVKATARLVAWYKNRLQIPPLAGTQLALEPYFEAL
jgi:hypothetical protein